MANEVQLPTTLEKINSIFGLRIDTVENWNKIDTDKQGGNYVPVKGEPIILTKDNEVYGIKIGDGETTVSNLPYVLVGGLNTYDSTLEKLDNKIGTANEDIANAEYYTVARIHNILESYFLKENVETKGVTLGEASYPTDKVLSVAAAVETIETILKTISETEGLKVFGVNNKVPTSLGIGSTLKVNTDANSGKISLDLAEVTAEATDSTEEKGTEVISGVTTNKYGQVTNVDKKKVALAAAESVEEEIASLKPVTQIEYNKDGTLKYTYSSTEAATKESVDKLKEIVSGPLSDIIIEGGGVTEAKKLGLLLSYVDETNERQSQYVLLSLPSEAGTYNIYGEFRQPSDLSLPKEIEATLVKQGSDIPSAPYKLGLIKVIETEDGLAFDYSSLVSNDLLSLVAQISTDKVTSIPTDGSLDESDTTYPTSYAVQQYVETMDERDTDFTPEQTALIQAISADITSINWTSTGAANPGISVSSGKVNLVADLKYSREGQSGTNVALTNGTEYAYHISIDQDITAALTNNNNAIMWFGINNNYLASTEDAEYWKIGTVEGLINENFLPLFKFEIELDGNNDISKCKIVWGDYALSAHTANENAHGLKAVKDFVNSAFAVKSDTLEGLNTTSLADGGFSDITSDSFYFNSGSINLTNGYQISFTALEGNETEAAVVVKAVKNDSEIEIGTVNVNPIEKRYQCLSISNSVLFGALNQYFIHKRDLESIESQIDTLEENQEYNDEILAITRGYYPIDGFYYITRTDTSVPENNRTYIGIITVDGTAYSSGVSSSWDNFVLVSYNNSGNSKIAFVNPNKAYKTHQWNGTLNIGEGALSFTGIGTICKALWYSSSGTTFNFPEKLLNLEATTTNPYTLNSNFIVSSQILSEEPRVKLFDTNVFTKSNELNNQITSKFPHTKDFILKTYKETSGTQTVTCDIFAAPVIANNVKIRF